MQEAQEKLVQ